MLLKISMETKQRYKIKMIHATYFTQLNIETPLF